MRLTYLIGKKKCLSFEDLNPNQRQKISLSTQNPNPKPNPINQNIQNPQIHRPQQEKIFAPLCGFVTIHHQPPPQKTHHRRSKRNPHHERDNPNPPTPVHTKTHEPPLTQTTALPQGPR